MQVPMFETHHSIYLHKYLNMFDHQQPHPVNWTMACIVLHNMLHGMRDDEASLGDIDTHEEADNLGNNREKCKNNSWDRESYEVASSRSAAYRSRICNEVKEVKREDKWRYQLSGLSRVAKVMEQGVDMRT